MKNVEQANFAMAMETARALAGQFADRTGLVDVPAIARSLGVHRIESRPMVADGYLGRQPDGTLIIRYRAQNGERRSRFTVAHEVAHILLAKAQGKDLCRDGAYSRDHNEELAVNRIAAELLMPEQFVMGELRHRDDRDDFPGWRIVRALQFQLAVSESAMALRMLEIQGLHALLFRINIEGDGPRFPCDRSEGASFTLANVEEFDAGRLWQEARRSNRHIVPIRYQNTHIEVRCEGLLRSIKTRRGLMRQYWVIGWEVADRPVVPSLLQ